MNHDPAGLYARLDLPPDANPAAIAAAFRRKARVLHPDMVGTGDVAAFVRMKEAYDVLSDPLRRAAYDRAARATMQPDAAPRPVAEPVIRGPRLSDLPVTLWIALGGLLCVAVVMAVYRLNHQTGPSSNALTTATKIFPGEAPLPTSAAPEAAASPTHYIVPAGGNAMLWQRDARRDAMVPRGQVVPFTSVQALRAVPQHGLVEIRLANGATAFIDATRLIAGDGQAARRAFCMYNAGMPPANGEVLQHRALGPARLQIENHGAEPAVVKLRDAAGMTAATVFIDPGTTLMLSGLPDEAYRPEFAVGELWSRACGVFSAAMRAQRFAGYVPVSQLSPLVIPPDLSVSAPPVDIPDTEFGRQ